VSYDVVKPDWYRIHTPDSPWHAGAQGWSQAPWPGWGENPNLIGPRMLAVNGFGSEMSVRPTTQRMALPGMPMPTVAPTPTAPTEKKIPWALIALAGLVAVGGYFMLKPARGSAVKSNGKMFANGKKRRVRRNTQGVSTAGRRLTAAGRRRAAARRAKWASSEPAGDWRDAMRDYTIQDSDYAPVRKRRRPRRNASKRRGGSRGGESTMSFRCSGCGKIDRSMFDKAGGEHWRGGPDGGSVCGTWRKLARDVGPGYSANRRKRRRA